MSESSAEANEADRVEHQLSVDDEEMGPELSPIGDTQAAEGDVLEQRIPVPGDDDDVDEEE